MSQLSAATTPAPLIMICVATYKRPEPLGRFLESLRGIELPVSDVGLIVVDNDPNGSGQSTVNHYCEDLPFSVDYCIESKPGISAARNLLVDVAKNKGADWIVFVDDDETVEKKWLTQLWRVATSSIVDVVHGPARPKYPDSTPNWIVSGNFMGRPKFTTGAKIDFFATNNVLIRMSVLDNLNVPFDNRFGLTGGSDTMLSMRLRRHGARMVWCDEAVVWEPVEESRLKLSWILKRAFRNGMVYSRASVNLNPAPRTRIVRVLKGLGRIAYGVLQIPHSWYRYGAKVSLARSVQSMAKGVGSVLGAIGLIGYQEYRRNNVK